MNDGGPAFPIMIPNEESAGMSLRDYFAAKAMHACINDNWRMDSEFKEEPYSNMAEGIAKDAYTIADAMLAVRSKTS